MICIRQRPSSWLLRGVLISKVAFASEPDGVPSLVKVEEPVPNEDPVSLCVAAADSGQALRDKGKLIASKEEFLRCSRSICPAIVVQDCGRWFDEVARSIPSVAFTFRTVDGADLSEARVFVEDRPVDVRDGRAVPVDPGKLRLRFEHDGFRTVAREVTIVEGEKLRTIAVEFVPDGKNERATQREIKAFPWHVAVLGGVALVGAGAFVGLAASAKDERDRLREQCQGACNESVTDGYTTKLVVANVALGVGVAALTTGIVFLVLDQAQRRKADGRASITIDRIGFRF